MARALDVLTVQSPCSADWAAMRGDEKKRFCEHCGKFVHNLAGMPADEAEALLCGSAGSLCVRFEVRAAPAAVPLTYRAAPVASRRRALATVASLIGAVSFTGGWGACKVLFKKPVPPPATTFVLGAVAMPTTTAPTTAPADPSQCPQ
jgi:hypothetical protein